MLFVFIIFTWVSVFRKIKIHQNLWKERYFYFTAIWNLVMGLENMDQILKDFGILSIPSFILAETFYDLVLKIFKGNRRKRFSHERTFGTCVSLATICYHFWISNEVWMWFDVSNLHFFMDFSLILYRLWKALRLHQSTWWFGHV